VGPYRHVCVSTLTLARITRKYACLHCNIYIHFLKIFICFLSKRGMWHMLNKCRNGRVLVGLLLEDVGGSMCIFLRFEF
jgi:hypothetical protein